MESLLERFLRYVKVDTQSLEDAPFHPSTPGQLALARMLERELVALDLDKIRLSEQGYLMAEIPANTDQQIPTVGFIGHNYHSRFEFISLESMQAAVQVIIRITARLESGLATT